MWSDRIGRASQAMTMGPSTRKGVRRKVGFFHGSAGRRRSKTASGFSIALMGVVTLPLGGCEAAREIAGPEPGSPDLAEIRGPVTAQASGGGHFLESWFTGITWRFSFSAIQRSPVGNATGTFRFHSTAEGLTVADFVARVTCMTVDPEHGRAWIGGIITQNRSEHPLFRDDPTTQVGQPTWFRVVDNGEGTHAPEDRLTRNFFTGAGGFQNEWEFCTADPSFWPVIEGVQRFTDPLLNGNIQVRP